MSQYPHARFLTSAAAARQFPPDVGAEIALAGRSNAGKSSALNAISARRSLARTGKTPGQTRLFNFFEFEPGLRIVDLPGYGYAAGAHEEIGRWNELAARLRERRSLVGMMLIVDARRGLADADLGMIEYADPLRRAVHVLLGKSDKLSRGAAASALRAAERQLGDRATVSLFSALKRQGLDEARAALAMMCSRATQKKAPEV
ncbi:MAG: ribosome biogenesis GTP-binding protein YihA/YsxC [Steroidobacteraceae bacterium]